jgi:serine/threonine-protein kinase
MTSGAELEPTTSPEGDRSPALLSVARPGLRIGSYTLHHLVGQGGMGSVWAATQGDSEQLLALKLVRADSASDDVIARFAREARLLFSVQHPAVARTLDAGVVEGVPYIAMELLVGRPLSNVVKREAPLPQDRAIDLFLRACVGVAVAHAHDIVHRDVKPSNFFIVPSADGTERVCLLDFGIAKLFDSAPDGATLTQTNMALGTPGYVAPEQFRNAKQADRRADIWSLGVMLFRLLTGRSPFPADSHGEYFAKILSEAPVQLRALLPAAPEELERVIGRCLRKDPAQRFDDVLALAEALQAFAPAQSHDALAQIRALPPSILLAKPGTRVDPPSGSLEAETLKTSSPDDERAAAAPLTSPAEVPSPVRLPSQRRGVILLAALGALLVVAAAGRLAAGLLSSSSRSSETPGVATVSPSPPPPNSLVSAPVEAPSAEAPTLNEAPAPSSIVGSAAASGKGMPPRVVPRLAMSATGVPAASASPLPRSSKLPWSRDVNDGN